MTNIKKEQLMELLNEGRIELDSGNYYPTVMYSENFMSHKLELVNVSKEEEEIFEENDIELLYPEFEHIKDIREEMEEGLRVGEFDESDEEYIDLLVDLNHELSNQIYDIYDYDQEPLIRVNGQEI